MKSDILKKSTILVSSSNNKKTIDNTQKHAYIDNIKQLALLLSEIYECPIKIEVNVKAEAKQVKLNISEINI